MTVIMKNLCCIGSMHQMTDAFLKDLNKGRENERVVYSHHVLEAGIVPGDGFVVSIGSEFIENKNENICLRRFLIS